MINILHGDCMDLMAGKEDNYYDLAIVDPPYGIGMHGGKIGFNGKMKREGTASLNIDSKIFELKEWDRNIPTEKYFNELMRVSKNQIIWGGNYFGLKGGYIFWDKDNGNSNFSDGELAYISSINSIRKFRYRWHGFFKEKMGKDAQKKIHPTEKPIDLYKWLLKNYAKEGDKILDTHGGSMSSAIACHDYKFDLDIIELDIDYYNAGKLRFDNHVKQLTLF